MRLTKLHALVVLAVAATIAVVPWARRRSNTQIHRINTRRAPATRSTS